MLAERRLFLNEPAPENYVAGVGRGAVGFTTRSDLGSVRTGPSDEQIKEAIAKRSQALDRKRNGDGDGGGGDDDDDDGDDSRYQDPDNEVGLFAGAIYDKDDEEADKIWKWVDERMDRRKRQREATERAAKEEHERNNPKIKAQFADLKRALGTVSDEEWAKLPEVGDLTRKNKRARQARMEKYYAVPDSVLAAAGASTELGTTVTDDDGIASAATPTNGGPGPGGGGDGTMTDFAKIGAARDKVLQSRLEQASQSAGTETSLGSATSIDPRFYMDKLNNMTKGAQNLGDVNRLRPLLESVVKTNPNNALGWIAAARLENHAGKTLVARKIIDQGCTRCPKSEDAWIENINLNEALLQNAKVIAGRAIEANPQSVRLWVRAMQLETIQRDKKAVIRAALSHVPESEALWKEAVNLEEDPDDARLILAKATETIPQSVDLWLALARLETPERAQEVLNRAWKTVPTSHEVWVAAVRLREQLGQTKTNIMERAVKLLAKESAMPKREEWIGEAEKCEQDGAAIACANIIQATLGWGLDEDDDRKDTWMEDARGCIGRGCYATARAIYAYTLRVFVNSKTVWTAAAELERNHGTRESLWQVLEKAVEACPKSEDLWLMLAKEKWQADDTDGARRVLGLAFRQNPDNEDIWLAAVKLEAENDRAEEARQLLEQARTQAPTDRVWMKSVVFERVHGNNETALDLTLRALQLFPAAPKLWMLKGQIYEDLGMAAQAREAYGAGVRAAPRSVPLWLLYARLEERAGQEVKARGVLDRARLSVPGNAELWCESVRLERRAGHATQARGLMERALREGAPASGLLWAERIWHLEPRTQRRPRSIDAIRKVEADPVLFVAVARIFWAERKLEKAQGWFERALVLDADDGDAWAWYHRFLRQHGTAEKRAELVAKCVAVEPRHGEWWPRVAKQPANARKRTEEILDLVADRVWEEEGGLK